MHILSLSDFLQEKKLFYPEYAIKVISTKKSRKNFLLKGPAGTGKTELASAIAQYCNAKLVFYQCTHGTSEDELLYKYTVSEHTKSGIKISLGPLPLALLSSQKQNTVLLIDEFDKTRPSADALLLDFLQNYRVSLYIDGKQVIQGNPDNLIVFLTSNDMREFSEPLLRRLTVISLDHLPTAKIIELLKQRFDENIALLLAQIYDDTIKAGLRKPATIQELLELGEFLEKEQTLDINELVKSFIIKYDDDFQKFINYIINREPYRFIANKCDESEDISKYYETDETEIFIVDKEEKEAERKSVSEILQRLRVKKAEKGEMNIDKVREEQEVTMKVEDDDFKGYTDIIKTFKPEPTDDPTKFGKFELLTDDKRYIVSREPFTLSELREARDIKGEYYIEDKLLLTESYRDTVINYAKRITYYTKQRIQAIFTSENNELILDLQENDRDAIIINVKIRGYLKGKPGKFTVPQKLLKNSENIKDIIESIVKQAVLHGKTENIPSKYTIHVNSFVLSDDYLGVKRLQEIIENARKLKKQGIQVKFTTNEKNYNIYVRVHSNKSIEAGIGHNYAEWAGYGREKKISIDVDDEKVDEIIEKIKKKKEKAG